MAVGIVAGFFLRGRRLDWLDRLITVIIWLLLFLLGLEVGGDSKIFGALPSLGLTALIMSLTATIGSCAAAFVLAKWAGLKKRPSVSMSSSEPKKKSGPLKGSLIILCFFVAGIVVGLLTHPLDKIPYFSKISTVTLCVLIFFVGISIGHNREVFASLKRLDWKLLLLPLFTILGTLAAMALLSLALNKYTLTDCLAVGAGEAYYSLSSVLITQSKGVQLGTIALLSNIIRELFTLLAAPLLYRIFGPLAPISAGGATTADTTLPIIRQVCGDDLSVVSVYHGFSVDLSVPLLVTLFCSI